MLLAAALAGEVVPVDQLHQVWNFGDPAASAEAFQVQIDLAKERGDADAELQYTTQLARTHSLRKDTVEAHRILDGVSVEGAGAVGRARYHLERGRAFRTGGEVEKAAPVFEEAYRAAVEAGHDGLTIDAAHMLALMPGPEATGWHDKGLALARSTTDERAKGWLGPLLNNKAWALHDGGEPEKALPLFEEAQAHFESTGKEQPIHIARWSVARCLRSLERFDEAWAIQMALVDADDGYVYEELGELARQKGEDAASWFAKAHAELKDDPGVAKERLARMAELAR